MAKYKIVPSSRTIVHSPISIGHKAEKGVEAIEFDLTAWVETYGSGTLTVIMRRWGDAIPYPIALEIDENNKATWTLSDTDTAKAGMAYAQLSYIVGETVVKKSDIYTFRVMDSLTGEGEPPEAYESWLEHLTHLAAEAMAEVLDIEGIVTDKTLTIDGGIADAKATGEALAEKVDAADYSTLSARVGANTIALAEKADRATTYTKAQVDKMIEDVEVETDTTLEVAGAPADAKTVGDELTEIKADLGNLETLSPELKDILLRCFEKVLWEGDAGASLYSELSMILTGQVIYKLGVNMSIRPGSYIIDYSNGAVLFASFSANNISKRRIFYADDGIKPLNDGDGNPTDVYPISVPKNVTWAKAEITPAERQLAIYPVAYDAQTQKYIEHVASAGYLTGAGYSAIPGNDKDLYLAVFTRYNASNAAYASEPSEVKITFGTRYVLGENMICVNGGGGPSNGKINLNTSAKRRTFYSLTGRQTSYDTSGNTIANRYPIPLPLNVKTVKAKIEPASMYIALYILSYNESTKEYSEYVPTAGYKEGQTEYEITSEHGELYALPVAKYDQAGSVFASEPTGLVIHVTSYTE